MLEDKKVCPHCGGTLHDRPYLMSQTSDRIPPEMRRFGYVGGLVIGFLVLMFVFHLLSSI